MKSKTIFDKYKDLFTYGNFFKESNPRIAYIIKLHAANSIHSEFKKDSSILSDSNKDKLKSEILDINKIKIEGEKPSKNNIQEFEEFIENLFANVDEEDREKIVTMKTAKSFKMVGELIEVFKFFDNIVPEIWDEKKKYCKFKAIDIAKSLKLGQVPKRGGPNEDLNKNKTEKKDEIENELNEIIREQEYEKKVINANKKNNETNYNQNSFNVTNQGLDLNNNQNYNHNSNIINDYNRSNTMHINNIQNNNMHSNFNMTFGQTNNAFINSSVNNSNYNINQNNNYNISNKSFINSNNNNYKNIINNNIINSENKNYMNSITKSNSKINQINKESKIKLKKINVANNVDYKSRDYYTIIDYCRNNIRCATNEVERGNFNNSLQYLRASLAYLNSIK